MKRSKNGICTALAALFATVILFLSAATRLRKRHDHDRPQQGRVTTADESKDPQPIQEPK